MSFASPGAGTPADLVDTLAAQTVQVLARPEVHDTLTAQGMTVTSGTPAQLAATIRSETQRWAEVIRRQNIQPQ